MISQRQVLRIARILLIGAALLMVWWFLRGGEKYAIPPNDRSLEPAYPGGTTLAVAKLAPDDPLERDMDVVYAMEHKGARVARFGRIRALPGDHVGSEEGWITVNGERVGPYPMKGEALGLVPEGYVYILAIQPRVGTYVDSRELGFIAREDVHAKITAKVP